MSSFSHTFVLTLKIFSLIIISEQYICSVAALIFQRCYLSERWSKEGRFDEERMPETADEWWMKEDSFSVSKDVEQNPFEKS